MFTIIIIFKLNVMKPFSSHARIDIRKPFSKNKKTKRISNKTHEFSKTLRKHRIICQDYYEHSFSRLVQKHYSNPTPLTTFFITNKKS